MYRLAEYQTRNTKMVMDAAIDAMTQNKMIGIIGYPGAGKSRSIEIFSASNSNVFSIQLGKSVTGKEMYRRILSSIDGEIDYENLSTSKIMKLINSELNLLHGNSLIVIDEAGFFSKQKIGYLLELYNIIWRHCGVLIMGPEYYEKDIKKWVGNGVQGAEEFYSRISYFVDLHRPSKEEIEFVFKEEGISNSNEGEKILKSILSIPKRSRSWRFVEHIIREHKTSN